MSTNIEIVAKEYFSTLNPIAAKIKVDIDETVNAYEHLWQTMTLREQIEILNETLIRPEISCKYFSSFSSNEDDATDPEMETTGRLMQLHRAYLFDNRRLSTYAKIKTGLKIVQDDVVGVFRDEHSIPFNVKTKSQINLNSFPFEEVSSTPPRVIMKTKAPLPTLQQHDHYSFSTSATYAPLRNEEDTMTVQPADASANVTEEAASNFLSKFICKNNIIFSTSMANENQKRIHAEETTQLVNSGSFQINSSSETTSDIDEDVVSKHKFEELESLLENTDIKKTYDFLNNW